MCEIFLEVNIPLIQLNKLSSQNQQLFRDIFIHMRIQNLTDLNTNLSCDRPKVFKSSITLTMNGCSHDHNRSKEMDRKPWRSLDDCSMIHHYNGSMLVSSLTAIDFDDSLEVCDLRSFDHVSYDFADVNFIFN